MQENFIDTAEIATMGFTDDEFEKWELKDGDLLLNDGQSPELVGRPAMYRDEVPGACYQNHILRFRAGKSIHPEFALLTFRHYLHSGVFREAARWTTNIATLSAGRFKKLEMNVPPLDIQEKIVTKALHQLAQIEKKRSQVERSLAGIHDMERELCEAAMDGSLNYDKQIPVGTRQNKEVRSTLPAVPVDRVLAPTSEGLFVADTKVQPNSDPPLAEVLRESGQAMSVLALYQRAGFDRDSTEDIERFYVQLRAELGSSISKLDISIENDTVELSKHASP